MNDRFEFVGTTAINAPFRGKMCTVRPIPPMEYRNLNHQTHVYAQFEGDRRWWPLLKADLRPWNPNKPVI